MRPSERNSLLKVIGFRSEGILWRELIGTHTYHTFTSGERKVTVIKVSKSTAARHLPQLIRDGLVQKTPEPRNKGERGRQSQRYKLAQNVQEVCTVPAIVINGVPFFGFEKDHQSGRKAFQLFPHDRQMLEDHPSFAEALKKNKLRERRETYRKSRPYRGLL